MFEEAYAELKQAKLYANEAYTIRRNIFEKHIRDESWHKRNEYTFRKAFAEQTFGILNMKADTYKEGPSVKGGYYTRSDGIDYVLNMMEQFGGRYPNLVGEQSRVAVGQIVVKPPYQLTHLSDKERKWHDTMPPLQEQLEKVVRYHAESGLLYYVEEGVAHYEALLDGPAYFIEIEGYTYARWRVISQLLLGNPWGVANIERNKELLDAVTTYNDIPFRAIHDTHKQLVKEADKDAPTFRRKRQMRTFEENAALVAAIKKRQADIKAGVIKANETEIERQRAIGKRREEARAKYVAARDLAKMEAEAQGRYFSERLFKHAYHRSSQ